jgi:hypothetical protein
MSLLHPHFLTATDDDHEIKEMMSFKRSAVMMNLDNIQRKSYG